MIVTLRGTGAYYLSNKDGNRVVSRSDGQYSSSRIVGLNGVSAPISTAIADETYVLYDGAIVRRIRNKLLIDKQS